MMAFAWKQRFHLCFGNTGETDDHFQGLDTFHDVDYMVLIIVWIYLPCNELCYTVVYYSLNKLQHQILIVFDKKRIFLDFLI